MPQTFRRSWSVLLAGLLVLAGMVGLSACQPTVRVEAPDKPIRIDLNVKIEQDVRIRLEESVETLHESNPDIF